MRVTFILVTLACWASSGLAAPASVDAAAFDSKAQVYYFFSGDAVFSRPRKAKIMEPPRAISEAFSAWPDSWTGGIDAATYHDKEKKFYFFRGEEFTSAPLGGPVAPPQDIASDWPGWPKEFGKGDVDAVIYSTKQKRWYYFKGKMFSRHKVGKAAGPAQAADYANCVGTLCDGNGFPGWPFREGVDAAMFVEKDKSYFFFQRGSYGAKPYGGTFDTLDTVEGNFKGWPTLEMVAAFDQAPSQPASTDEADSEAVAEEDVLALVIQTGHTGPVRQSLFLDNNRVLSMGDDGIARVWDIQTGKEVAHVGQYDNPQQVFAAIDSDQRWLLLADTETVTQYDAKTLTEVRRYPVLQGIQNIAVHDNNLVVVYPREATYATVSVFDLETAESARMGVTHRGSDSKRSYGNMTFESGESVVMYADFHPRAAAVVTTGTDGKMRLWRDDERETVFAISAGADRKVGKFAAGLLGEAIGGATGDIVADVAGQLAEGVAHASNKVVFSPDGDWIVSAHLNGKLAVWDSGRAKKMLEWVAHDGLINDIDVDADGKRIVTTGNDGSVKIWNVASGQLLLTLTGHSGAATSASFSPDGSMLLTGGKDRMVLLWDKDGKVIRRFERRAPGVSFLAFHPRGNSFITADRFDPFVRQWNMRDATLDRVFEVTHGGGISSMALSPDGRTIAIGTNDRQLALYDLSGRLKWKDFHREGDDVTLRMTEGLAEMLGATEVMEDELRSSVGVRGIAFSEDGRHIITVADNSNRVKLWDAETGAELAVSGMRQEVGATVAISANGRVVLSQDAKVSGGSMSSQESAMSWIVVWDPPQAGKRGKGDMAVMGSGFAGPGKPKRFYQDFLSALEFLPDGRHVVGAARQDMAIWDIEKGERVQGFYGIEGDVTALAVSPDGKLIASGSTDNVARLWRAATGEMVREFRGHTAQIYDLAISEDQRHLLTGSSDGTARLWNLASGDLIVAFSAIGKSDYVVATGDHFYTASKGATRGLAFTIGERSFPFDQFDLQLNRPDIVINRLGLADEYLRKAYAQAAKKRMRKFGVEASAEISAQLPAIRLVDQVPVSTAQRELLLKVEASDAASAITRLLINVNDVPVFGGAGMAVTNPSGSVVQQIPITLSQGSNKVQVSARNREGVESLRQTFEVAYTGSSSRPSLHVVTIGVSDYIDDRVPDLSYAAKDAGDIGEEFAMQQRFDEVNRLTLANEKATRANIEALKAELMNTQVDDHVVVFLAGHGLLDQNFDYYFAPTDLSLSDIAGTGVSYDTLEGLLDGIPARNKLMLIDTCHAGDTDEDQRQLASSSMVAGARSLAEPEIRKVTVTSTESTPVPAADADVVDSLAPPERQRIKGEVYGVFDLMKSLFVNLDKGSGAVVISAAASDQYALESDVWNNGVFTFSVLEGLRNGSADLDRDGEVTAMELHQHVSNMVEELTDGEQVPTTRREQTEFDFRVF